jgi:hypothetical protein
MTFSLCCIYLRALVSEIECEYSNARPSAVNSAVNSRQCSRQCVRLTTYISCGELSQSFIRYGMMAGRDGIFAVEGAASAGSSTSSCIASGDTATFHYGDRDWAATGTATGFDGCYAVVKQYILKTGSDFVGANPKPAAGDFPLTVLTLCKHSPQP